MRNSAWSKGFGHVVERPELESLDRGVDRPVRGDHDHRHVRETLADRFQNLHAVELRHAQVRDQNIDVMFGHGLEHRLAVGDAVHLVPIVLQLRFENAPQIVLVVGDENLFVFGHEPECSAAWSAVQTLRVHTQLAAANRCSAARITVARFFRARS